MSRPLLGTRIAAVYELQAAWMEPRLAEIGVTWSSFQLLTTVAGVDGGAPQIEVANRMGVTAATLSEAVQSHVERGLLCQEPSKTDRRVRLLSLTPESARLMQEIKDLAVESEKVMVRGVAFPDLAKAASVLERVMENLQSAAE